MFPPSRSMNILEQQARTFFLRCRVRSWQSQPRCTARALHRSPHRAYSITLEDNSNPAPEGYDPGPTKKLYHDEPNLPAKPYYVTTPIYYVNAEPHVGHLYSLVLADVLKRWRLLFRRSDHAPALLTGTDEHGMKVQKAAEKATTDTGVFCTMNSLKFKNLANKANISYDRFIRTTDDDHKAAVAYFFTQLQQRGHIYRSKHEGWYCVSDETFYPESQIHMIIEPQTGRKIYASKETGKEVQWTSEENYHFRLSNFRDKLLRHYEDNPDFIVPYQRMNFVKSEVERGLSDLSVSRPSSRLQWGIRVPGDETQTIYVWLDALINYITMAGYPFVSEHPNQAIWPPECQVIGKDIIRFHCIYWPAFLMALDLPLPKQFLSHAHWTMNQEKMSKSLGNVVNPFHAIERFGVDTVRYYMVRDGGYADDAPYENAFIIERYKKELQGGLGNLVSRILRTNRWDLSECIQHVRPMLEYKGIDGMPSRFADQKRAIAMKALQADQAMEQSNPREALGHIMSMVSNVNKFLQEAEPWRKASSSDPADQNLVKEIVYRSADELRCVAILLQPFMPQKMKLALDMLGVRDDARHWVRAGLGSDWSYGVPRVDIGRPFKGEGSLFPPLTADT